MKNNLFFSWPGVLLAVALIFSIFAWRQSTSLGDFFVDRSGRELESRARLFSGEATRQLEKKTPFADLQALFVAEGKATGTRFTLIAADGKVLADSDEDPAKMDNHLQRLEISDALKAFGDGASYHLSVRYSTTRNRRMIYCAMPLEINGVRYVLRSAFSIHEIDEIINRVRRDVLWAVLITALVAAGFYYLLYRTVTRPVQELCRASTHIAAGWLDTKLPVPAHGAIRQLGNSMTRRKCGSCGI